MLNSLTNDKILDGSKIKAFADDKINVTQEMKFVLEMVENIIGKGKNAGYQHFLLLYCSQGCEKSGLTLYQTTKFYTSQN